MTNIHAISTQTFPQDQGTNQPGYNPLLPSDWTQKIHVKEEFHPRLGFALPQLDLGSAEGLH